MIVLVDMDGVIADWNRGFWRLVKDMSTARGVDSPLPPFRQQTSWQLMSGDEDSDSLIRDAMSHPRLYKDLQPMSGARKALREMSAEHDVFLCSTADPNSPTCAQDKMHWVNEHLGEHWKKRLVMTYDKTVVRGHVLIDDKPRIEGVMTPMWKQVLFDAPYNRSVKLPRLTRWSQWRDVVAPLLKRG